MRPADDATIPAGPLAVRWRSCLPGLVRAGVLAQVRVELENAGSVTWHSDGPNWIYVSYHWLDLLGNAIVWDGLRTRLPVPVPAGGRLALDVAVRGPIPPGRYRLAFDLLDAERLWFGELGNPALELDVQVEPRIGARTLAVELRPGPADLVEETRHALAAQEGLVLDTSNAEVLAHLAPGCQPAPDWSRRLLDAHAEGYAAVGGSVEPSGGPLARRRAAAALAPWRPGGGRNPSFAHPLLLPSLVRGLEPSWLPDVEGLPALRPPEQEPWLYDARVLVRARPRSGRRPG